MEITKEGALDILEQMCADSAVDFEEGAIAYLDAVEEERKALAAFRRDCYALAKASKRKYNALQIVIPEVAFLTDKEKIKPGINGREVVAQLLINIVENLDANNYRDIAKRFIGNEEEEV